MRPYRTIARLLTPALFVTTAFTLAGATIATTSAEAAVSDGVISANGPLTQIQTTADLNCAVNHAGDTSPEFFGTTACATLVALDGTLYGPANIPAGAAAGPRTTWITQAQTSSGAGTTLDPYRVVTVVKGGVLVVTQTDTYVEGSESYGTRVSIENTAPSAKTVTLYRAGDCYLQNSDVGYGSSDAAAGSVACTTGAAPGSRVEQWAPLTAGSHFFESGYRTVWARIGAQLPFPDTSDDSTSQDNGAGLSWTSTIGAGSVTSFSHLTAFSPTGTTSASDSDGDGFPDTWEEPSGGVDTNGDGVPDLKLSDYGATPDKPDVFVQVNWTQTRSCLILQWHCSTKNRRPSLAALNDVQKAFSAHGVRLHVDAGSGSVMNPDNGARWGARSQVQDGVSAPALFTAWRNDLLSSDRSRIFHSAFYVGRFNDNGNSGLSRGSTVGSAARDFILAVDTFPGGQPTRQQEAGTFMHELGHNLGLSHGGSSAEEGVNYKPNYPSVMNYFWQMSGTYKNDSIGLLDYSEGTLSTINERSLNESTGLEPDTAANNIATMWACPGGSIRGPLPSVREVDWNCDGTISTGPESANVTGVVWNGVRSDTDLGTTSDHDDWASLVFDGNGALGAAGDPSSVPASTPPGTEPTADELIAAAPDVHAVRLTSPGQLAMQTGTASPVEFTISNDRDTSVTYDLSQSAEGVTLTGVPDHVTLAAGASSRFTGTLTAGPVSDAAFFEVDAQAPGDPSNTASASTEVYVVNETVPDQPPTVGALDHITVSTATTNAPAGTPVTFSASGYDAAGHDLGTLPGMALAISPDGTCTGTTCTATIAGTHTVTATSGVTTGRTTLLVTPAAPAAVTTFAGDGQSATAGQMFQTPLEVLVSDAYGNPVPEVTVTFTSPSGATFVGATTFTNAITAASGRAVAAALTAGTVTGPLTVSATVPDATAATFTETVTAAGRARADLAVTVSAPAQVRQGQLFTVTVKVKNNGPNDASDVLSTLAVPRGIRVLRAGGCRAWHNALLFRTARLGVGQTMTYTLTLRVEQTRAKTLSLWAMGLSATSDPARRNNTAHVTVKIKR